MVASILKLYVSAFPHTETGINKLKKMLGLMMLLLAACVSTSVHKPNDTYINVVEKTGQGDTEEAVRLSIECARQGHGGCAEIVANYYLSGEVLPLDLDKAEEWFLVAVSTEVDYLFAGASGAINLAQMYCDLNHFKGKSGLVGLWVEKSSELLNDVRRITNNDEEHAEADSLLSGWIKTYRKKSLQGSCKNERASSDDDFI